MPGLSGLFSIWQIRLDFYEFIDHNGFLRSSVRLAMVGLASLSKNTLRSLPSRAKLQILHIPELPEASLDVLTHILTLYSKKKYQPYLLLEARNMRTYYHFI